MANISGSSTPAPMVEWGFSPLLPETSNSSADNSHFFHGIYVQLIISPILVTIGTIGNIFSFIVLIRKRMRGTAMYNFLLILSVADTLVLWLSCLRSWVRSLSGYELMHISATSCKVFTFLFLTSTYVSSWLIVLLTIDRFLAVWFPLECQTKWSLRQARGAVIVLLIVASLSNAHVFWTFGLQDTENRRKCTFDHRLPFMSKGFDTLKLFIYCFIPFIIALVLNVLIIFKVNQKKMHQKEPLSTNSQQRERISYLLLSVSITWLVLMLPYSLIGFIDLFHDNHLLRIICFMLLYTNHSINFFLYCLTGRKFRSELKAVFTCCHGNKRITGSRRDSARSSARTDMMTENVALRNVNRHDGHESGSSKNSTPPRHIRIA